VAESGKGVGMRKRWNQLVAMTAVALVLAVFGWNSRSLAQTMPILLQITSPPNGTVVHPGQTGTFVAAPIGGDAFTKVWVDGPQPFEGSQMVSNPPYQLSLVIPQEIAAGKYAITAYGARAGQNAGKSTPIDLDVEPSAAISKITASPETFEFRRPCQRDELRVIGTFQDGSTMDITQSTGTTYTSGDPARVTVDGNGILTAVSGRAGRRDCH